MLSLLARSESRHLHFLTRSQRAHSFRSETVSSLTSGQKMHHAALQTRRQLDIPVLLLRSVPVLQQERMPVQEGVSSCSLVCSAARMHQLYLTDDIHTNQANPPNIFMKLLKKQPNRVVGSCHQAFRLYCLLLRSRSVIGDVWQKHKWLHLTWPHCLLLQGRLQVTQDTLLLGP